MPRNRTLDWHPNFDEQSVPYRLALLDCYKIGLQRRSITRKRRIWLDQGQEGACTGFGEENVRAFTPHPAVDVSDASARRVYQRARFLDEWPGEDYDGSSVNGAMKAAREFGWVSKWHWAFGMDEVKHGLSFHGPGEMGIWWYTGMFEPDSSGFIHPTGVKEGGHAICVSGYRRINGGIAYQVDNSWGPDWGVKGGALLWEQDLQMLLADDGEFAVPTKIWKRS